MWGYLYLSDIKNLLNYHNPCKYKQVKHRFTIVIHFKNNRNLWGGGKRKNLSIGYVKNMPTAVTVF